MVQTLLTSMPSHSGVALDVISRLVLRYVFLVMTVFAGHLSSQISSQ